MEPFHILYPTAFSVPSVSDILHVLSLFTALIHLEILHTLGSHSDVTFLVTDSLHPFAIPLSVFL